MKDPLDELSEANWNEIKSKYETYVLNEEENRSEALEIVKELFINNLKLEITRYSSDPLNTEAAVHVTDSELQSGSEIWKKERIIRVTASDFKV